MVDEANETAPQRSRGDERVGSSATLPAGARVGKYEILAVLGHGGFGITYRARDTQLGREVAIKEYLPSAFAVRDPDAMVLPRSTLVAEDFRWGRARFLDEAKTLALLEDAPGIVNVYDFLEANGTAYMVMALVRGETLEVRLRRDGALPQSVIEQLLPPLLEGLERVHEAGFLHRDIKPANILIDRAGRPTLIDFGASRAALQGRTQTLTAVYTPGYAAFEQFTSAKQGPWTDIYALGATLYHCVTGAPPPSAIDRMREDTITPAAKAAARRVAPQLLGVIDAALKLREVDRPQSMADWRRVMASASPVAAVPVPPAARWSGPVSAPASGGIAGRTSDGHDRDSRRPTAQSADPRYAAGPPAWTAPPVSGHSALPPTPGVDVGASDHATGSTVPGADSVALAMLALGLAPLTPWPVIGLAEAWWVPGITEEVAAGVVTPGLYLVAALAHAWRRHWRVPVTAAAIHVMATLAWPLAIHLSTVNAITKVFVGASVAAGVLATWWVGRRAHGPRRRQWWFTLAGFWIALAAALGLMVAGALLRDRWLSLGGALLLALVAMAASAAIRRPQRQPDPAVSGARNLAFALLALGLSPFLLEAAIVTLARPPLRDIEYSDLIVCAALLFFYLVSAVFHARRQGWRVPPTAVVVYTIATVAGPLALMLASVAMVFSAATMAGGALATWWVVRHFPRSGRSQWWLALGGLWVALATALGLITAGEALLLNSWFFRSGALLLAGTSVVAFAAITRLARGGREGTRWNGEAHAVS